jgi:hypothetical protein
MSEYDAAEAGGNKPCNEPFVLTPRKNRMFNAPKTPKTPANQNEYLSTDPDNTHTHAHTIMPMHIPAPAPISLRSRALTKTHV